MSSLRKLVLTAVLVGLPVAALAADPPHQRPDPNRTISRQDWMDQSGKRFDAIDTNKDGKITPDERKVAFAAHRHHVRGDKSKDKAPAATPAPAAPAK